VATAAMNPNEGSIDSLKNVCFATNDLYWSDKHCMNGRGSGNQPGMEDDEEKAL